MTSDRLLIVSNRLPVTAQRDHEGAVTFVPSVGGLATALSGRRRDAADLWLGWTGDASESRAAVTLDGHDGGRRLISIPLTPAEISGYYEHFSNGVLWPLFHYLLDRVPVEEHDWLAYQQVNRRFADAVIESYRPGDRIWIHDYHLMLVPQLLRAHLPDARIGFFLHVPFPSSEVFRILPWRAELLEGLLGADVIGFHTYAYVRHFAMAVLHILGIEPNVDCVTQGRRTVQLKAVPLGIDAAGFAALAQRDDVRREAAQIRREAGGRRILLGIDRLDYTKGLPRRLLAFERLLATSEWRDRLRLIQIAVPSREHLDSYRDFKGTVEQLVGRINGQHGTIESQPIHYLHQTVTRERMTALFLAADVMLVTPLRDGLNLVAKEFVASRCDDDGVLVLSEFAGAAAELGEAVIVNPYDVDGLADALDQALRMRPEERIARMRALRSRVMTNTVDVWASTFIDGLTERGAAPGSAQTLEPAELSEALGPLIDASPLDLVLDYDGTLVPIQATAAIALPDPELGALLELLCGCAGLRVHLVSGRSRDTLEHWFGDLPLTLWAEHGFWSRPSHSRMWAGATPLADGWDEKVRPIIEHFTTATPGAWLEAKSASLSWHYRLADPEFGARQAHELRMWLGDALSNQPLEVREGKKVVEVRLRGIHKGQAISQILAAGSPSTTIIAVGDDATDEDMFVALPPERAAGVHVGRDTSQAQFSLATPSALRQFLNSLLSRRMTQRKRPATGPQPGEIWSHLEASATGARRP